MGIIHRPQATTELIYYPVRYYFNRVQDVFGPGEHISPGVFSEAFDNSMDGVGSLIFDNMTDGSGFVLIDEG